MIRWLPSNNRVLRTVWQPAAGVLALFLTVPATVLSQELVTPKAIRDLQTERKGVAIVDVRPSGEFQAKHIEGAINVPASRILEAKLSSKENLVLYCGGESCSLSKRAALELLRSGYKNVAVLEGGISAWEAAGNPVEGPGPVAPKKGLRARRIAPKELYKQLMKDTFRVLDVRPRSEYISGHLPGAMNLPLEEIDTRLVEVSKDRPIVVCDRSLERSRKAGELLIEKGYAVQELAGGIGVWVAMKLPLEM